jgi:hypothetical protein
MTIPGEVIKSRYLLWWQKKELEAAYAKQKEDAIAGAEHEEQHVAKVRIRPYCLLSLTSKTTLTEMSCISIVDLEDRFIATLPWYIYLSSFAGGGAKIDYRKTKQGSWGLKFDTFSF